MITFSKPKDKLPKGKEFQFGKDDDCWYLQTKIDRLKEENKKLKEENKELREARTVHWQSFNKLANSYAALEQKKIPHGFYAKAMFLIKNKT